MSRCVVGVIMNHKNIKWILERLPLSTERAANGLPQEAIGRADFNRGTAAGFALVDRASLQERVFQLTIAPLTGGGLRTGRSSEFARAGICLQTKYDSNEVCFYMQGLYKAKNVSDERTRSTYTAGR